MKIGIIDSGLDRTHRKLCACSSYGVSINGANQITSALDDYHDCYGHGTACAGIIHKHNPNAELFIVKILSEEGLAHEKQLCSSIELCLRENVDIINISMGIQTNHPGAELVEVCEKAYLSGVVIVAAANNSFNLEAYPAHFPSTFGVISGRMKSYEYAYDSTTDYFIAKGDIQRVLWKDGKSNVTAGTSFACAHLTGLISKIKDSEGVCDIDAIKKYLIDNATTGVMTIQENTTLRKIPYIQQKDLDKIGNALFSSDKNRWIQKIALFPISEKEMNTFAEFPDSCKYKIMQSIDYPRSVTSTTDKSCLKESDWDSFDTCVLGYFQDQQFEANVQMGNDIVKKAIGLNKNLFVFDLRLYSDVIRLAENTEYTGKIYTPNINHKTFETFLQFKHLPEVKVPVIAVIGTSNKQGKFTTQLRIRKILETEGYKTAHIATEPHGELFGAAFSFPYGHKGTVVLKRRAWLEFLRILVKGVQNYNMPNVIITGTQGGFIPRTFNHVGDVTTSLDYIFGIQPDAFVCAINPQDTIEQINDVFNVMNALTKAKPLFCVLTPHERRFMKYEDNMYTVPKTLLKDEYVDRISFFKQNLGIEVFDIWDKNSYRQIIDIIEDAF